MKLRCALFGHQWGPEHEKAPVYYDEKGYWNPPVRRRICSYCFESQTDEFGVGGFR